jgi:hypothetical protein
MIARHPKHLLEPFCGKAKCVSQVLGLLSDVTGDNETIFWVRGKELPSIQILLMSEVKVRDGVELAHCELAVASINLCEKNRKQVALRLC